MNDLERWVSLAARIARLSPNYFAYGPLVLDTGIQRWFVPADECDAHALACDLLRLSVKQQPLSSQQRQVLYVRERESLEHLECGGQRYPLNPSAQSFLEAIVEILEQETGINHKPP